MGKKLRLVGVSMVASECDIIESFARHNLSFVDHLHIQLHNSFDSTQEIIEKLIEEGLSISFELHSNPVFRRELMGDTIVQEVANEGCFDYILPLDADELIVADDRGALEHELSSLPGVGALKVPWLSYVPTEDDDATDLNPITRIRHRLRSLHSVKKVFFARHMLQFADVYLADGNHDLLSKNARDIPHRQSTSICLAHFPVRSWEQLISKIRIGAAARLISPDFTEHQSPHWRMLENDPLLSSSPSMGQLSRYATDYLGSRDKNVISAPLSTTARTMKYAKFVKVDPLDRLWKFVSALLTREEIISQLRQSLAQISNGSSISDGAERRRLLNEVEVARRLTQSFHEKIRSLNERIRTLEQRLLRD